jgi:hypothetical protein
MMKLIKYQKRKCFITFAPEAADALEILIIIAHVLGLFVNLLLGKKAFSLKNGPFVFSLIV